MCVHTWTRVAAPNTRPAVPLFSGFFFFFFCLNFFISLPSSPSTIPYAVNNSNNSR